MRGLKTLGAALVAALVILELTRVRPNAAGTRLLRGRTLSTGSTGGAPGHTDALGVPATITANGQTAWLDSSDLDTIIATLVVGGATGTSPTLDVVLETSDAASGNVVTVGAFTQRTGAGSQRKVFAGLDAQYRFRWTVGGTSPSFTGVSISGEAK